MTTDASIAEAVRARIAAMTAQEFAALMRAVLSGVAMADAADAIRGPLAGQPVDDRAKVKARERTRRWREKRHGSVTSPSPPPSHEASPTVTGTVTENVTDRHKTVTVASPSVTSPPHTPPLRKTKHSFSNISSRDGPSPKASHRHTVTPSPTVTLDDAREQVRAIIEEFPAGNSANASKPVRDAIRVLRDQGGPDGLAFDTLTAAGEWLLGRVRAYASSPLAKTTPQQFRKALRTWLIDECYADPESAWAHAYQGDAKQDDPLSAWAKAGGAA